MGKGPAKHIMLDLETMGIEPNAAIVAIGAVKFTGREIVDRFERIVALESSTGYGGVINPQTEAWWNHPDRAEAKKVTLEADDKLDLKDAIVQFTDWAKRGKGAMVVWGNGSDFDNVILSEGYKMIGGSAPWRFWNNRCFRTAAGMYPAVKIERSGLFHRAVDDAETQARHLIRLRKEGYWK